MRVMGIDPGLAVTGYAVLELEKSEIRIVEVGVIRTKAEEKMEIRLKTIYQGLKEVIVDHSPSCLAVEKVFAGVNIQSTIKLAHARAMAVLLAGENGLDFSEFSPREVKQNVTGNGAATKEQVQFMVKNILKLEQIPKPNDAADAVAVALSILQAYKFNSRLKNN